MLRAVDIIARKRDGCTLSSEEITFFIEGYTRGDIPDYQAAAWLMAVVWRGMDAREATDLTLAMARSGDVLELPAQLAPVVDKHSTGGVGDKTTLVVAPLVASLGLAVAKMSGRGLSFSGGTIDKLECIPGLRVTLSRDQFVQQLLEHGIVVASQSAELAPADGKLYALRDVTATVESLPLIASSIMSKKIAAGAHVIVLDVKAGKGAFMKTEAEAEALARLMIDIGQAMGRRVGAIISDMNQPLGQAVGNALEVGEAIATLRGGGPADFREHCLTLAGLLLVLGGRAPNLETARPSLAGALDDGRAWQKFVEWITAQGGSAEVLEHPERLPRASLVEPLCAPRAGYLADLDAYHVGMAALRLGAGREKKGDSVDPAVGVVLHKKVGDRVEAGEPVLTIHANHPTRLEEARHSLLGAMRWSDQPPQLPAHLHKIIG